MKKVKFEMNELDVRKNKFDHHMAIPHGQAFIAKMSSIQLIEWYMCTGQIEILDIEFNHHGHIDDLVAVAFNKLIKTKESKYLILVLYQFACRVSILDSCGPNGNVLVSLEDNNIIDDCLGKYHQRIKNMGYTSYNCPLDIKRECMEYAADTLLQCMHNTKDVTIGDIPEIIELPDTVNTEVISVGPYKIMAIDFSKTEDLNPFRYASSLYAKGYDIVIATGKEKCSIMAKSNYSCDLSGLWEVLSEEDPAEGNWGGHSGAGGSPRGEASQLTPNEIVHIVKNYIN